jgi:hypothetical protein
MLTQLIDSAAENDAILRTRQWSSTFVPVIEWFIDLVLSERLE